MGIIDLSGNQMASFIVIVRDVMGKQIPPKDPEQQRERERDMENERERYRKSVGVQPMGLRVRM